MFISRLYIQNVQNITNLDAIIKQIMTNISYISTSTDRSKKF